MPELIASFDPLLQESGPAAVVLQQWLKPVGGEIFYPPTYANPSQKKGDPPVYNIDPLDGGRSVCVVDSIPSQANRIEPAFAHIAGGKLVPQVIVKARTADGDTEVNLLEAGHRAADAVVRFSSLAEEITKAVKAYAKGDSLLIAKLAPTSLVFGMWDSRHLRVKVPRLLNSIIRAYDVTEVRRSAQYTPALNYAEAGVTPDKGETGLKKLSDEGMADVPATFAHGGVEARGGIRRDGSINLATLRDLTTDGKEATLSLQRYILGLSLVAITWFDGKSLNLRQGCQLVAEPQKPMTRVLVNPDGTETPFEITRESAVAFAEAAAKAFGVGPDRPAETFDPKAAKAALKKKDKDEEKAK